MTSFGWKRKIGCNVSKNISKKFAENSKGEEDEALINKDVDWLTLAPKRQCLQLEDAVVKSNRLRQEGITLAESERFWEALHKLDEALQLTPCDETLYEMKAQALMSLGEVFPAVTAAEKAVSLNGTWWIAHQTLGRALLGLGEVKLALKSFCRAFHQNPVDEELFKDDLMWSFELICKKAAVDQEQQAAAAAAESCLNVSAVIDADDVSSDDVILIPSLIPRCDNTGDEQNQYPELQRLPPNYVIMRH